MRVGCVGYCTEQGIGRLMKGFYNAGIVTDVHLIPHSSHVNHWEWYSDNRRRWDDLRLMARMMDVMFFIETPFDWDLIGYCRQMGKRTVLMPMYECFKPEWLAPHLRPDLYLCPSELDLRYFSKDYSDFSNKSKAVYLPTPVEVPWRQRTRAEVFVHNAGHGGLRGRNGTLELVQSLEFVKSPIKLILRHQNPTLAFKYYGHDVIQVPGTHPYETLWDEGDVFVFPEKFQGQSCPLEEARAAGMLVMGTDRFPMNQWLPTEVKTGYSTLSFKEKRYDPLVPIPGTESIKDEVANPLISPTGYRKARVGSAYNEFDEAVHDPRVIAAKIDEWFGRDITEYSLSGLEWAKNRTWTAMKDRYLEVLRG